MVAVASTVHSDKTADTLWMVVIVTTTSHFCMKLTISTVIVMLLCITKIEI
jgi:hypothetical protein